MSSLSEIERRIKEDWPGSEPAPLAIVHALTRLRHDASDYLTLPLVMQLLDQYSGDPLRSGDREAIASVYRWTEYLASERIGLLDPHFELIRNDGTTVLLDHGAVAEALKDGALFDPDSGAPVDNWKQHIVIFYSATDALREILGGRS